MARRVFWWAIRPGSVRRSSGRRAASSTLSAAFSPRARCSTLPDPSADAGAGGGVPAIHALDLTKRYGHIEALAGLSMSVPRGEIFGFLGPNGAGKTTAVKLLLGLTTPTAAD